MKTEDTQVLGRRNKTKQDKSPIQLTSERDRWLFRRYYARTVYLLHVTVNLTALRLNSDTVYNMVLHCA